MADHWFLAPDGGKRGLISKEQNITFWGNGNIFYAVQYGSH